MQFSQIVGLEETKTHLRMLADEGRMPHALMLSGSEGVGALGLAVALAQYMACSNRHDGDSCGVCPSCRRMAKLQHPDLNFCMPVVKVPPTKDEDPEAYLRDRWIEALQTNPYLTPSRWYTELGATGKQGLISAEMAEAIIEKLWYKPVELPMKFMVVWQPERMHPVAANRLLKVVEEPPEQTVFLFVSHHPELVLPTILSRVQQVIVPPVLEDDMVKALQHEGADSAKAQEIARVARGNYAQALELLREGDNQEMLALLMDLLRSGYSNNYEGIFTWVSLVLALGREREKELLAYLARMVREIYMLNLNLPELCYLIGPAREFAAKVAPYVNGRNIGWLLDAYQEAYQHVAGNGNENIIFTDLGLRHCQLLGKGVV